jgi:hypothetical protein
MALERRDRETALLLRGHGADENVPDVFGFTVEWHLRLGSCGEVGRKRRGIDAVESYWAWMCLT